MLDPRKLLVACHPDLIRLAEATPQTTPFQIDYGLRTLAEEVNAVDSGHSQTLHSRHLADIHYMGKAMAFDFFVVGPDRQPDWNVEPNGGKYALVGNLILATAAKLSIRAQWGGQSVGAWIDGKVSTYRDYGHIQLDPSAYQ